MERGRSSVTHDRLREKAAAGIVSDAGTSQAVLHVRTLWTFLKSLISLFTKVVHECVLVNMVLSEYTKGFV